jgi:pimeloyl-ACP methyl ester carboxylesterase
MSTLFTSPRGLAGWVTGTGTDVLLLHGGPGLSDYMAELLPELDGFRVASFQQRGITPSTVEGPFDVATSVADVVEVLDALGWDQPTVIGHSWGGHLLLHLLAAAPDRVGAALVVDPLGAVGDGGLDGFEAEMDARLPDDVRPAARELDSRLEAGVARDEDQLEAMRLYWPCYFADRTRVPPMPAFRFAPASAYGEMWASLKAELPALAGRLSGRTTPARFVHGAESPIPVSASVDTADVLGAEVDVVPGCGHFPWLERPGSVRRSLDRLLAG